MLNLQQVKEHLPAFLIEAGMLLSCLVIFQVVGYSAHWINAPVPDARLLPIGAVTVALAIAFAELTLQLDRRIATFDDVVRLSLVVLIPIGIVIVANALLPHSFRPFKPIVPIFAAPVATAGIVLYRFIAGRRSAGRADTADAGAGHEAAALTDGPLPWPLEGRASPIALRAELRWIVLATGVSLGATVAVALVWLLELPFAPQKFCCDAAIYMAMAQDPSRPEPAPFSSRVLTPWIVHAIGTNPAATYHVVSLICLAATGPLMYLVARRLGVTRQMALLSMAALLLSRGWTFYLYDPWLSDPAAFPLIAAAFLAIVSGRAWLMAPILVVLAGTRELFVTIALPAYAWQAQRYVDIRVGIRVLLQMLPALVGYELLITHINSTGALGFGHLSIDLLRLMYEIRLAHNAGFWIANTFALSLGIWWLLAIPSWRDPRIRRLAWWLVPVFLQLLIGSDWSRYAFYAFPVVMPAAALALDRMPHKAPVLALIGVQCLLPWLDLNHPSLDRPGLSLPVTIVLMAVTAIVLFVEYRPTLRLLQVQQHER